MKKRFVSLFLVSVSLLFTFACKTTTSKINTASNAIIGIYYGGYGTEAVKKIATAFNNKEENKNAGLMVSVSDQGGGFIGSNVTNKLQGAQGDFDLLLTATVNVNNIIDKGEKYTRGYNYALEELTDIYNSNVYGESQILKDKMIPQFYKYNTIDGKQYSFNWASGPSGIAYRADYFKQNNWTIPRTTQELRELGDKIKKANYTPYIWSSSGSYWYYSVLAWWRQLIDEDEFNDFWNAIDSNGTQSVEVFKSQARLEAFEELESILGGHYQEDAFGKTQSDGYLYDEGSLDNISAQIALYTTKNKICMMANGDWLENEMKQADYLPGEIDIGIFKTPITSKILLKYDSGHPEGYNRFSTVTTEEKLREVISAIDEGLDSCDGVSSKDFQELKVIRSYTGTEAQNHIAFIPAYANAKEVAKKFVLFLASDEAMQIYYDETGTFMPFNNSNIKINKDTTFKKDLYHMATDSYYLSTFDSKNPIFYKTDLNFFMSTKIEQKIATASKLDKMTGYEYWEFIYDKACKIWDVALAQSKS